MATVYNGYLKEIGSIGLPNECQKECVDDINCKGFVHQFSNQTCWLKGDTNTIVHSNVSVYVGPKNCLGAKGEYLFHTFSHI